MSQLVTLRAEATTNDLHVQTICTISIHNFYQAVEAAAAAAKEREEMKQRIGKLTAEAGEKDAVIAKIKAFYFPNMSRVPPPTHVHSGRECDNTD